MFSNKFNKKLSQEIRYNAENMDNTGFYNWLIDIPKSDVNWTVDMNRQENWNFCNDFAKKLACQLNTKLEECQWPVYEIKALFALNKLSVFEDDIVEIDAYGFPKEIKDTDRLLQVLGLDDYLVKESDSD